MSGPYGRIVREVFLSDQSERIWQTWVTAWDDGRVTVTLHTPNDPNDRFYGLDGPRFDLEALLDAVVGCRPEDGQRRLCGACGHPLTSHAAIEGMCRDCTCLGWCPTDCGCGVNG